MWFEGPSWILLPKSEWPKGEMGCMPQPLQDGSFFDSSPLILPINVDDFDPIINIESFSSYARLLAVTMRVFAAVSLFQSKASSLSDVREKGFIHLIRVMQKQCFPEELEYLAKIHTSYEGVPKLVKNFNLFVDKNGIMRSKGRISKNTVLSYDAINPILLYDKHHLTKLIIRDAHWTCKHMGVESTLNYLRHSGFWVLNVRNATRKVIKECVLCTRYNVKAFSKPPSPTLPSDRVNLIRKGIQFIILEIQRPSIDGIVNTLASEKKNC